MAGHGRIAVSVFVETADPRSDDFAGHHSTTTAKEEHDSGSGKVRVAEDFEPSIGMPTPAAQNWIGKSGEAHRVDEEAPDIQPVSHCTRDNNAGQIGVNQVEECYGRLIRVYKGKGKIGPADKRISVAPSEGVTKNPIRHDSNNCKVDLVFYNRR